MSDFHKKFVRVEWLALQKASDLMREVGWDESYFISQSQLIGDEGLAAAKAESGRDLFDMDNQQFIRREELHAEDFGLEEEIGEFFQKSENLERDYRVFLKRTYSFDVFKKGEGHSFTSIAVAFAKATEKDDWTLVHECVVDHRRNGNDRWIIYRTKDLELESKLKQPRTREERRGQSRTVCGNPIL